MIYRSPYPELVIPSVSLTEATLRTDAQDPDGAALIEGPSGTPLSYGELYEAVDSIATGLALRGIKKGDVVAIQSPNVPEFVLTFLAVLRLGAVVTPINPANTVEETLRQVRQSGAVMLFGPRELAPRMREIVKATGLEAVVFGRARGCTSFTTLRASRVDLPDVSITPDDLAVLPFSSGTTGFPKGVLLTHGNLVANLMQIEAVEDLQPGERVLGLLPFYHIYGLVVLMASALRRGATLVTLPAFELADFLASIEVHQPRSLYLVPPLVQALALHPLVQEYDLSSVAVVTSGAAPLPMPVAEACQRRLGVVVKQGYGLTETSPVTHLSNPDRSPTQVSSIGQAVPNTSFRIVDTKTGVDLPPNQPGELLIQGPQVMKGYLDNEEATQAMLTEDGWLHTGDVATVDAGGHVYIVDRLKELIKYKGQQVAPAELEALLQGHDSILDVAVVPSPSEEAGEVPKAFVVPKPSHALTEEGVMAYVADHVAPYKRVRLVEFVQSIPRSASGKILRRMLVEQERKIVA